MTYLPFLNSLTQSQPQSKEKTMREAASSVTRLELTNLTDDRRTKTDLFPRRSASSPQPSLLHIAACLLVLGLAVILSLAVLAVFFSPAEVSQDSDLFNVLLAGGRGKDNSSLLTVELLNIGGCPAEPRADLLIPSLPLPLSHLTVSYLNATNTIALCGADTQADWRCFTLRNYSTTWEISLQPLLSDGGEEGEGGDSEVMELSHRHGASLLTLSDRFLLIGGRSCEGDYPTEVLELRTGQTSWSRTQLNISEGRAGQSLSTIPCSFIFASKPKFYKLLDLP